jgi:hypothetical protein
MSAQPVVTFKRMPPSLELLWAIRQHTLELSEDCPRLHSCEVAVEPAQWRGYAGRYRVMVDVSADREPQLRDRSRGAQTRPGLVGQLPRRLEVVSVHARPGAAVRQAFGALRHELGADSGRRPRARQTPSVATPAVAFPLAG